jgi:hypothetical protein
MSNWEPHIHTTVIGVGTSLTQLYPSGDGPTGPRIFGIACSGDFYLNLSDDGTGNPLFVEQSSQGPFWICADDISRIWVRTTSGTLNFMVISYHPNSVFPGR